MKVGDMIKTKSGHTVPGLIIGFAMEGKWAKIHWSDSGPGLEKIRDIEVISDDR